MAKKQAFRASSIACAVTLSLASVQLANAKSVTVTGEIETKAPVVVATMPKTQVEAFVEPVEITLSEGDNSGCTLTTSEDDAKSAKNDEELVCAYDVTAPYSMVKSSKKGNSQFLLSGILGKIGDTSIPVSSVFFSGSANTPVDIPSEPVIVNAIAPVPLIVNSVDYRSNYKTGSGDTFEINTPDAAKSVRIDVTTDLKDYDRKIVAEGITECHIRTGIDKSCELDLSDQIFGSEDDRFGEKTINLYADADNEYFSQNNQKVVRPITIKWDSRLPEYFGYADSYLVQNNDDQIDLGATVEKAENGQMVLVVKTPHYSRTDDWWNLTARARIVPDEDAFIEAPDVDINGTNYRYLWETRSTPTSSTLKPVSTEQDGEYYKFYFDASYEDDAAYNVTFTVSDALDNSITVDKYIEIENVGYEHLFFINNRQYDANIARIFPAYFPQDVDFAIFSRFRDLTVKSVKVNGTSVTFEDVNGDGVHYQLTTFPSDLASNEEATVELTVVDDLGQTHVDTAKFIMQPFTAELRYDEAYDDVQEMSVDLRQEESGSGTRECVFYNDEESAADASFEYSTQLHCYLEFLDLDGSMAPTALLRKVNVVGLPAKDNNNPAYKYRVHFLDKNGLTSVTTPKTMQLTSLDVPEIELSIKNGEIIENDANQAFAVPVAGGKVAEVRASMINADGTIVAQNPFGDDITVNITQSGYSTSYEPRSYFRVYTNAGKLWEQAYLTVKAGYRHDSARDTTEQISMVYVPNDTVKAYIDLSTATTVNTEDFKMPVGIGVMNKDTDSYVYDKATDGEWMLQLQKRNEAKEYVNIGNPVKLPESGKYTFSVDTSGLTGSQSYRYRVVATVISGYEGYSRTIESKAMTLKVQKGGAVDFTLETKATEGTRPFTYKGKVIMDAKADKKAWGHTNWYMKKADAPDWTLLEGFKGRAISYKVNDAGNYLFKAEVVNQYTEAKSSIVTDNILVYQVPSFELVTYSNEFTGLTNVAKVVPDDASRAYDVLWSTDNCETFVPGNLTHEFVVNEASKIKVCAKVAFSGTEQAGESRWEMERESVRIKDAEPIEVRSYTDKTSEVGFETELVAKISVDKDIRHKLAASWYAPTGDKIDTTVVEERDGRFTLTAKYLVTDADLAANRQTKPFFIKGELVGVPNSESTTEAVMDVLTYEFPDWDITVKQEYLYAPTTVTVYANMVKEPEVEMTYAFEWLNRDGVTLTDTRNRDTKGRAYYKVTASGNNEFAVLIKDERGNEKLFTVYSVAETPDPAEVKLKVRTSNATNRYPVDISIRPSVIYNHKKDSVKQSSWFVNGEKILTGEGSEKLLYTATEAGDYTFKFVAESELGATDEISQTITVVPNKLPTCEITYRERSSSVQFTADCDDEDGDVRSYQIEIPELDLSGSTRDYILDGDKLTGRTQVTVRLTATDDSDESVTEELTYNVPSSFSDAK